MEYSDPENTFEIFLSGHGVNISVDLSKPKPRSPNLFKPMTNNCEDDMNFCKVKNYVLLLCFNRQTLTESDKNHDIFLQIVTDY